jgi:hypothetical protein
MHTASWRLQFPLSCSKPTCNTAPLQHRTNMQHFANSQNCTILQRNVLKSAPQRFRIFNATSSNPQCLSLNLRRSCICRLQQMEAQMADAASAEARATVS